MEGLAVAAAPSRPPVPDFSTSMANSRDGIVSAAATTEGASQPLSVAVGVDSSDSSPQKSSPGPDPTTPPLRTVLLGAVGCLVAHSLWGLYPVVTRLLQTRTGLATFPMWAIPCATVLLFCAPVAVSRHGAGTFRSPLPWGIAGVVVLWELTNLFSSRLTRAAYLVMIRLTAPYMVAALTRFLLHERLPSGFFASLLLNLVGGVLIICGDVGKLQFTSLTIRDMWGFLLAFAGSFLLSVYLLIARLCARSNVPAMAVLVAQMSGSLVTALLGSCGDPSSWVTLGQLPLWGWLWMAVYVVIQLAGNLVPIWVVGAMGPPFYAVFVGWSLCVGVFCGWVLLGETLTAATQLVGVALVVTATSAFLGLQYLHHHHHHHHLYRYHLFHLHFRLFFCIDPGGFHSAFTERWGCLVHAHGSASPSYRKAPHPPEPCTMHRTSIVLRTEHQLSTPEAYKPPYRGRVRRFCRRLISSCATLGR
eukprot:RCo012457